MSLDSKLSDTDFYPPRYGAGRPKQEESHEEGYSVYMFVAGLIVAL